MNIGTAFILGYLVGRMFSWFITERRLRRRIEKLENR